MGAGIFNFAYEIFILEPYIFIASKFSDKKSFSGRAGI